MNIDNRFPYHEIDFLLPAQRFSIQFSYISQKGLPFIREFVLRLIHLAPMSKSQISVYFGLSKRETNEAISDLVQRGELTLSSDGRLTLTDKSKGYFFDLGEVPKLSNVQDSGVTLSFDLATFNCVGNENTSDKWSSGLFLTVDGNNASCSEKLVEKHFQQQFNQILNKGYLPNFISQDGKDSPSVYTVNSVNKIRQMPLRLKTFFEMDHMGKPLEREDYGELNSSEAVHEIIAHEISRLSKPENMMSLFKSMMQIGDEETLKLFDSKTNTFNPKYITELNALQKYRNVNRTSFLGPIYIVENWERLLEVLAPVLDVRIKDKVDTGSSRFVWIAPTDPFWGKSNRFISCLSTFMQRSSTKSKKLYQPTLFVPVVDEDDYRGARQWQNTLGDHHKNARGIAGNFLDGNVELLYFENEFVVVIYHFSQPEFPVSMPLGFISKDILTVQKVGETITDYIASSSSFNTPNDCGAISSIGKSKRRE